MAKFSREFKIDRAKVDKEKRTVELAFSSETPVERWGENEVLGHADGEYDFGRLNSDHPLLLGHDESNPRSQIGVVETAKVDSDKVGRAVVRFGRSPLAEEIFQDVLDGIRKLVSVGYDRTGIISRQKAGNGMTTTRYRWEPTHIALVPVPADLKAGVGRDANPDDKAPISVDPKTIVDRNKPEHVMTADDTKAADLKIAEEARASARKAFAERRKELRARVEYIAKYAPHAREAISKLATDAEDTDEDVRDVSLRMSDAAAAIKPAKQITLASLGCNEREAGSYSVVRAIQSCIKHESKIPDGFEGEIHAEMAKRNLGFDAAGFVAPSDAPVSGRSLSRADRRRMQRDMQVGVFGQGGATVATELLMPIIEILRNRMVTTDLGVRSLAGLEGNVVIPRQTSAGTAYSVTEIAALTTSNQVLDQIALSPKRVGATGQYSKQLLLQSSLDVENFIRDDLLKVIAIDWDRLILNGSGAGSEPLGVMNVPGVASVTFGAAATYAKLVSFWTQIASANADVGEMGYVTTPASSGVLQSAAKLLVGATTVTAVPLWEGNGGDGRVNGYRALSSNQIPGNQMVFGVWSEIIHALWGGLDIVVDPFTLAKNAEVVITINTWGDVAVRHPQCFAVSSDAANQ